MSIIGTTYDIVFIFSILFSRPSSLFRDLKFYFLIFFCGRTFLNLIGLLFCGFFNFFAHYKINYNKVSYAQSTIKIEDKKKDKNKFSWSSYMQCCTVQKYERQRFQRHHIYIVLLIRCHIISNEWTLMEKGSRPYWRVSAQQKNLVTHWWLW